MRFLDAKMRKEKIEKKTSLIYTSFSKMNQTSMLLILLIGIQPNRTIVLFEVLGPFSSNRFF